MKTTLIKAKEIAKTGTMDKAWEVAKKDEGLSEGVNKEQWIEWMPNAKLRGCERAGTTNEQSERAPCYAVYAQLRRMQTAWNNGGF